ELALSISDVEYLFFIEKRPLTPGVVAAAGDRNREVLSDKLTDKLYSFIDVEIISEDSMPVAGRNAVAEFSKYISNKEEKYTDIIVDTSSMSRGVCFSVTKQAMAYAKREGINAHLL